MADGPVTLSAVCAQCGSTFEFLYVGKGRRRKVCYNPACHRQRNNLAAERHRRANGAMPWLDALAYYRVSYRKLPVEAACKHCGTSFMTRTGRTKSGHKEFCSRSCGAQFRAKYESDAARALAAKVRRRTRIKAAKIESVDPFKVFERDGWRCHLCGCKTPKEKRGTYHPKAPELDHIMPLSKGGEHSYRNTACACRACNAAKSDKILGQPSLLAA